MPDHLDQPLTDEERAYFDTLIDRKMIAEAVAAGTKAERIAARQVERAAEARAGAY